MRRLRDIFYINAFPENNEIVYYGMELREFTKYAPVELNRLLLLEAGYLGTSFSSNTRLEIVDEDGIEDFLKEDFYSYGDLCWVDFNRKENIEKLEAMEVAELLYLGHMFKPVKSPFFEKIENRYAYLAHDDGWFCRLYCKEYNDFQEIIANKIIGSVSTSKRRKIYPLTEGVKEKLLLLAVNGLIIDFNNILKLEKSIEIPIYTIGKFLNMDTMYNDLKRHISNSNYSARLVQKNKSWTIDYVIEKQ